MTNAIVVPQFQAEAVRDLCDAATWEVVRDHPGVITALYQVHQIQSAVQESADRGYNRQLILSWVLSLVDESIAALGGGRLTPDAFDQIAEGDDNGTA